MRVQIPGAPPRAVAGAAPPPPPPPRSESGIVRADKLAGDIGYLEVSGFPPLQPFKASLDKAMAGFKDTKALIIDVRRNGGGSPDAVSYLVSHFIDPAKRVHINSFINRTANTKDFTTQDFFSSPTPVSYLGKPIYVLTAKRTFSGGEEFAYDMQALKLGTLVGEVTGGGANPGGLSPVGSGLAIFLPGGRAKNPITGTNWEGTGVKPDIATPPADALKVALERLGQKPTSGDIAVLSVAKLFEPRSTITPGAEAATRRMLDELARGEPDYTKMGDALATATRQQLANIQTRLANLGALESLTFRSVAQNGGDVFDAKFANGAITWTINLDASGKVTGALMGPPPQ
jgi:hypothetical protein